MQPYRWFWRLVQVAVFREQIMTSTDRLPDWSRSIGCAFLYWIVFLLALEPGNILHARSMGRVLEFDREALRIGVAALLGCSTAPVLIALVRRFPIDGTRAWRSIVIHAAGSAVLSIVLILISCVLVAWVLQGQALPSLADVRSQLAANWLLLTFALCAFAVLSHAMKGWFSPTEQLIPNTGRAVAIKTRGRLGYLDVDSIEWIEAQGNYLALHVGGRSHLIRETLQNFGSRLDPDRFIRVHRRVIVAIDQVREIQPLTNGDSTLILQDGRTIRASRSYRESVRKRWAGVMSRPTA
jgi:two-component system, LytTR family, response regulator